MPMATPVATAMAVPMETPPGDATPLKSLSGPPGVPPLTNRVATRSRNELALARMAQKNELWLMRRSAMAKANGAATTGDSEMTAHQASEIPSATTNDHRLMAAAAQPPAMAGMETGARPSVSAEAIAETPSGPMTNRAALSYTEVDKARRAMRDEMQQMRRAAMAEAQGLNTNDLNTLTVQQRHVLEVCVAEAGGVSRALAADSLEQYNRHLTNLSRMLPLLPKTLGAGHRWNGLAQRLVASSQWSAATDLTEARRQFLPFSTALVEFVKQLRMDDPAFVGLKLYHCPMAPKPGLWMQTQGPLANPFYGAKMLTCGEEVGIAAPAAASPSPTPTPATGGHSPEKPSALPQ
jgi:hypothetical protein